MFSEEVEQKIKDKKLSCLVAQPIETGYKPFDEWHMKELQKWYEILNKQIEAVGGKVIESGHITRQKEGSPLWITNIKIAYEKP